MFFYFCFHLYCFTLLNHYLSCTCVHCAKYSPNLRIKTDPVLAGADVTVFCQHSYTVASASAVTGSVFRRKFRFILGQCTLDWVNMYKCSYFPTFSCLDKLIYHFKSQNKQIFANPCTNSWRKLNDVRIFLHCTVTKLYMIEIQFFAKLALALFYASAGQNSTLI